MSASTARLLPGGVEVNGRLDKRFSFKPIDGRVEMFIEEAVNSGSCFPEIVSEVLYRSLRTLGDAEVDQQAIKNLSVGDRQYLIKELAEFIVKKENWLSVGCGECQEKMDVSFRYDDLPVKSASDQYPHIKIKLGKQQFNARVPNGADQEVLATVGDETQALALLLQRIIPDVDDSTIRSLLHNKDALTELEAALEEAAPEVGTQMLVNCPHCQRENTVDIDLYQFLTRSSQRVLTEVHQLALHYHWSEQDILALPQYRRKQYLTLIDSARGMTGSE